MPHGPQQNRKKVRDVSKRGWGGSSDERPYDVSRGQNRYVTLPLVQRLPCFGSPAKMGQG